MFHGDKKHFAKNGTTTYVVTDVEFLVAYEPDVRQARKYNKDGSVSQQFENAQGMLTINETLDEFPKVKKQHMDSWNYYVWFNGYDEDEDYTEEFQTAKTKKRSKGAH